jgi:hypothetical protein
MIYVTTAIDVSRRFPLSRPALAVNVPDAHAALPLSTLADAPVESGLGCPTGSCSPRLAPSAAGDGTRP